MNLYWSQTIPKRLLFLSIFLVNLDLLLIKKLFYQVLIVILLFQSLLIEVL